MLGVLNGVGSHATQTDPTSPNALFPICVGIIRSFMVAKRSDITVPYMFRDDPSNPKDPKYLLVCSLHV